MASSCVTVVSLSKTLYPLLRSNKKISVFLVTGPNILGRVDTLFFWIFLCILKGISPFKIPKKKSRKPKKSFVKPVNLGRARLP